MLQRIQKNILPIPYSNFLRIIRFVQFLLPRDLAQLAFFEMENFKSIRCFMIPSINLLKMTKMNRIFSMVLLGFLCLSIFVMLATKTVAQSTLDWWSMFRHDQSHLGSSTSTGPLANGILWRYTTGGAIDYSSPAVIDGVVYVASDDHYVYALDLQTAPKYGLTEPPTSLIPPPRSRTAWFTSTQTTTASMPSVRLLFGNRLHIHRQFQSSQLNRLRWR